MLRFNEDKLKEAVMSGNLKLARDAIAEGADVNVNYDKNSDNPHLDDLWRMVKIFEPVSILEIDCRPAKHNWGNTPLHHAVDVDHTELVELLIKSGADVNARDLQRETPLHIAAQNGNREIAELLIKSGADVNDNKFYINSPPLHTALSFRNIEVAKLLIDNGADVNAKSKWGFTPLQLAKSPEIAKILIDKGARLDAIDNEGRTPLHTAISELWVDRPRIKFLIENGADVNAQDNTGRTPLYIAVLKGYYDIAEFLIQRGADLNVKDNDGNTPLNVTKPEDHQKIIKMMLCCIDYLKRCDVDEPDTVDLAGHSESDGE